MADLLMLVCDNCGEAFDTMVTAKDHEGYMVRCSEEPTYQLLPESEAM